MASAGNIDAPSVKIADIAGSAVRSVDAGKTNNGRKRHIVVDTLGLLILVVGGTTASLQDCNGGRTILQRLRFLMPSFTTVFVGGGYADKLVIYTRQVRFANQLVNKPKGGRGFAVLPRRWLVECNFSRLVRCPQHDKDHELLAAIS